MDIRNYIPAAVVAYHGDVVGFAYGINTSIVWTRQYISSDDIATLMWAAECIRKNSDAKGDAIEALLRGNHPDYLFITEKQIVEEAGKVYTYPAYVSKENGYENWRSLSNLFSEKGCEDLGRILTNPKARRAIAEFVLFKVRGIGPWRWASAMSDEKYLFFEENFLNSIPSWNMFYEGKLSEVCLRAYFNREKEYLLSVASEDWRPDRQPGAVSVAETREKNSVWLHRNQGFDIREEEILHENDIVRDIVDDIPFDIIVKKVLRYAFAPKRIEAAIASEHRVWRQHGGATAPDGIIPTDVLVHTDNKPLFEVYCEVCKHPVNTYSFETAKRDICRNAALEGATNEVMSIKYLIDKYLITADRNIDFEISVWNNAVKREANLPFTNLSTAIAIAAGTGFGGDRTTTGGYDIEWFDAINHAKTGMKSAGKTADACRRLAEEVQLLPKGAQRIFREAMEDAAFAGKDVFHAIEYIPKFPAFDGIKNIIKAENADAIDRHRDTWLMAFATFITSSDRKEHCKENSEVYNLRMKR